MCFEIVADCNSIVSFFPGLTFFFSYHAPKIYTEINEMVPTRYFEFLGEKQGIIIIFFTHIMNLLTFRSDIEVGISLTAGVSFY